MARDIVDHLNLEFASLLNSLKDLASSVPRDLLYRNPPAISIGENILRSAAAIEQTCGGLATNLWDDPFEWTLPETLSTPELVVDYLSEVDLARQRAFNSIHDDGALSKYISVASGEPRPLVSLLLETLVSAGDYRGRAIATFKILSSEGAQGFII
ncbi:MAG TPA: hypothetical protein VJW17_13350 [Pyrinomonadaceae bacterium]|nr:hypothetical protein [Pyrinomonadaceae bacterium]